MRGEKLGISLGIVSVLLSLMAYVLGSAPFTPALVITYVSIPTAFMAFLLGAARLAILAVYFGTLAWFTVPLSAALPLRIDYLLALCFALGCILGLFFYANYRRTRSAN